MSLAAATLQLPGYTVTETLYTGTRTLVYRGQRQRDNLPVVIKLLRQEHPRFSDLVQFRYQYTLTKNLDLPTVIKSYSLEPYRNGYALVMEDFGGLSIAAYVKENGRIHLEQFWSIALQLTDILHSLYQQHIIHKDIKPANILIHPDTQQIKLIDFSIASLLTRETQASHHPSELEGTLAYLAPEQTGRMNRGVDYRSDFYALGVTFFELLTGRLPFESTDPMELVHCHLAKYPPLAHTIDPAIPIGLARLVDKLMAKNAEDRYQSALGLKYDLEQCRSQWTQGTIAPFELGTRDVCDRFLIPETLYGREPEVAALLAAFERVASTGNGEWGVGRGEDSNPTPDSRLPTPSRSELILIAGFSGIGKTAVVHEVQKPIARQRGYFIQGKYDQFQRNIPFSAFVQAFRGLIGQLLSESDTQLERWKQTLLSALGEQGQVILEVIPELERLIGQQPPVPELSGEAAQNRFNRLFQQFIQVFTAPEHPLVIFIDDLQWADSASLKLMTVLMSAAETHHLLFLGAYRDHEVTPAHPLMLTLEAIRNSNAIVHLMTLKPLDQPSVNQLVADTLSCDLATAAPLADLVMSKTNGNPFFTTQFLKALHEEGQIRFNVAHGGWECDIAQVRSLALTDDVVEFMALQLQKLPADTQTVLQLAACIGNQFDLQTLAIVHETTQSNTAAALWKAIQDGLILPQSDVYKFYQGQEEEERGKREEGRGKREEGRRQEVEGRGKKEDFGVSVQSNDGNEQEAMGACAYKFLHDRVQQAAYALIPASQRSAMHLKIGRLLLKQTAAMEWDDRSFAIVNHLNLGSALMDDRAEREILARLNLAASHRAKLATAYAAAVQYVGLGLNLLPPDPWHVAYELTLALHLTAAETAYLTTDFDQAETLIQTIWQRSASPLDCVKAYEIAVQIYIAKDEQVKAIETGLAALEQLGVALVPWDQAQALPSLLTPAEMVQQPTMTDPVSLAALRILITISPPVHHVKPELFPMVVLTMLDRIDRYGYAAPAAFAYGSYGLFLGALIGDPEAAHQAGQLSLAILEHYPAPEFRAKVNMLFAIFVCAYKESGHTTLALLKQGVEVGLDTGDIEHASYSVMGYFTHLLLTGQPLESVEQQQTIYLALLHQYKQEHCIEYANIWLRSTQQWLLDSPSPALAQSQAEQLQHFEATNNQQCLFALHLAALITTYTLCDYAVAVDHAQQAAQSEKAAFGLLLEIAHNFYYSLALLAQCRSSDESSDAPDDRHSAHTTALEQVAQNQTKMQTWAAHAPMNGEHKYALVEAERCRLLGQRAEAMEWYDRAIAAAQANNYLNEESLAHELAATFYLGWGKERLAQAYMIDAYYAYARWGATLKVARLEQTYPQLLAPILQQRQLSLSPLETVVMTKATLSHSSADRTTSSSTASLALDFAAILKASQALSSEIELEPLLTTLLQIVTESAGADYCALLLLQEDAWMVAATRQRDQSIAFPSVPLDASQAVPIALIHAVKRSLEPSVIMNAAEHSLLLNDLYVLRQQPQSILCTPILQQGKLLGILYLENNVITGAFTSDRVELLNLLCAQAAIALENARLYQQSQQALAGLSASEARFQRLAANLPGMIYQIRTTPDGEASALYVSSGCTDLYEMAPEAVLTNIGDFRAMEHPDDRPAITQSILHSAQTLTPFSREWRVITPSGKLKWIQSVARPEPQADGSIVWDGVQLDISERKQAEVQLQRQAEADQLLARVAQTINQSVQLEQVLEDCLEQVRQFFQSDRVLVCRFDAAYNTVIEIEALSQPEFSLLGQTIEDPCFDQGWAERYRQGYVTACNDAHAPHLTPCYAAILAQIQVQASLAVGILQGDQIWGLMVVHYCHQPYAWQQSEIDLLQQLGLQIGIANQKAILHTQLEAELAERRRTETALRLSEERYRCLANVTTQLLWTTDADGQVVEDLPSWRAYTGQSFEAIKDVGAFQALHPDDYEHVLQAWTHAVQTQSPYRLECRVRSVDATYRYFDIQGVPVLAEDDSIREWMGACVDIDDRKRAEQQLQASQQLLALVLNTIPHKVFWKDRNLVYQGSNRAFADVVGFTPTEIVGKSDYDLPWTTAESDWFRECDRRVMESNRPELGIVETTLQADGTSVWIETSKLPLHDASGAVIGILGVYQDITDRKQAEATLQQTLQEREHQSRLLQTVLDSTQAWIFAKDRDFRYIMVNRSYADAIGQTVEAMLGKDDLELGFPEELVLGNPEKGIRGFRPDDRRALAGELVHNPYDPANIADGFQRILDTRKTPLYASDGTIFAMLGFCNDVTELKRAETQLRSQKQELEQTLQALRRTQSQMVQSEKMSGLGQLVAGVAHEINNPVNFIYGNLTHANSYTNDILRLLALYQKHYPTPHAEIQTEVNAIDLDFLLEDLPKLLASMRVGAERIQKIVASLRNFSRMDEAEVKAVNLHEGIDSTLMILQHRLKATSDRPGIEIIKAYGNLPLVECYAGQLNQVFMNVLSNAIDALEEQMERQNNFQPTITINTALTSTTHVQMRFADNGPGIPAAVKARLFDPFFTTKPVGKGTGMGLSISHQIVTEKHGGSLQCVSAPGQGTAFAIEIPIQR